MACYMYIVAWSYSQFGQVVSDRGGGGSVMKHLVDLRHLYIYVVGPKWVDLQETLKAHRCVI